METQKDVFIHKTIVDRIIDTIGNKLSWLYVLIVIISCYEIVMRYVFNSPTSWVHETAIGLAAFLMLFAGLYTFSHNKHIRVPIILEHIPQRFKKYIETISDLVALYFISILVYASYKVATKSVFSLSDGLRFHLETSGSSWNPPIPGLLKGAMLVILVLFFFQILTRIIYRHFSFKPNYQQIEEGGK